MRGPQNQSDKTALVEYRKRAALNALQNKLIDRLFSRETLDINWVEFSEVFESESLASKFGVIFGAISTDVRFRDSFLAYCANKPFAPEVLAVMKFDADAAQAYAVLLDDDALTTALKLSLNSNSQHYAPDNALWQKQVSGDLSLRIMRYLRAHNKEKLNQVLDKAGSNNLSLFQLAVVNNNPKLINFYCEERPDMILDKGDMEAIATCGVEIEKYLFSHPILAEKIAGVAEKIETIKEANNILTLINLFSYSPEAAENFLARIASLKPEVINYDFYANVAHKIPQNLLEVCFDRLAYRSDVVIPLLEKTADVSRFVETITDGITNKLTPLFYTIRASDLEAVRYLVETRQVSPDQKIIVDGKEIYTFMYAISAYRASNEATEILKILISNSKLLEKEVVLKTASSLFDAKCKEFNGTNVEKIKLAFSRHNNPVDKMLEAIDEYIPLNSQVELKRDELGDLDLKLAKAFHKIKEKTVFALTKLKDDKSVTKSLFSEILELGEAGFFLAAVSKDQQLRDFFSAHDEQLQALIAIEGIDADDPQRIKKFSLMVDSLKLIFDSLITFPDHEDTGVAAEMIMSSLSREPGAIREINPKSANDLLRSVILHGDSTSIEFLINLGAQINHEIIIKAAPLCQVDIVNFLLEKVGGNPGLGVLSEEGKWQSILTAAIAGDRMDLTEFLLNRPDFTVDENVGKEVKEQLMLCSEKFFYHLINLPKFQKLFATQLTYFQESRIATTVVNELLTNPLKRIEEIEEIKHKISALNPQILSEKILEVDGKKVTALEVFLTEKYSPTPEKNNILKLLIGKFCESKNPQEALEILAAGKKVFRGKFTAENKPNVQDRLVIVEFDKVAKILHDKMASIVETNPDEARAWLENKEIAEQQIRERLEAEGKAKEALRLQILAEQKLAAEKIALEKQQKIEEEKKLVRQKIEQIQQERAAAQREQDLQHAKEVQSVIDESLEEDTRAAKAQSLAEFNKKQLEEAERNAAEVKKQEMERLRAIEIAEAQRLEKLARVQEIAQEELRRSEEARLQTIAQQEASPSPSAASVAPSPQSLVQSPSQTSSVELESPAVEIKANLVYLKNIAEHLKKQIWLTYDSDHGTYYIHDFDKNLIALCDDPRLYGYDSTINGAPLPPQVSPEILLQRQEQQLQYQAWQLAQKDLQIKLLNQQVQQMQENPGRQPQPGMANLVQSSAASSRDRD